MAPELRTPARRFARHAYQDGHRPELCHRRFGGFRTRARRLLGRMVRPVPDDRPGAGGNLQRARRKGYGGQAQYRRKSRYAEPLWRAWDPDDAAVQRRPARGAEGRRRAAQPDSAMAGELSRFSAGWPGISRSLLTVA